MTICEFTEMILSISFSVTWDGPAYNKKPIFPIFIVQDVFKYFVVIEFLMTEDSDRSQVWIFTWLYSAFHSQHGPIWRNKQIL